MSDAHTDLADDLYHKFRHAYEKVEQGGQTVGKLFASPGMVKDFASEGSLWLYDEFRNRPFLPCGYKVGRLWTVEVWVDDNLSLPLAFPAVPEGTLPIVEERWICPS